MSEIDYSKYTLQEMYEVYAKLDNERDFFEANEIFDEIQKREKELPFTGEVKLAPRGLRLIAISIDAAIVLLLCTFAFRFLYRSFFTFDFRRIISLDTDYLLLINFIAVGSSCLIYFLINGYSLHKSGQTIGKKIIGIKITDEKGGVPPLSKTYLIRFFIPAIIASLPVFGYLLWFIDALFIFTKNKKCLHDHIAETQVRYSGSEIYF